MTAMMDSTEQQKSAEAPYRKTTQRVPPASREPSPSYELYPGFDLGPGRIGRGYDALAEKIAQCTLVVIDGFVGVLWDRFRGGLDAALARLGMHASWLDVSSALLPEELIAESIAPYLGGDDPLFGTVCRKHLIDFFDPARLAALADDMQQGQAPAILYGTGASLADVNGALHVYVDVPKDEIQFRSRAGSVVNLGAREPEDPKAMYKRFYFVDWPVLGIHKANILNTVDLFMDGQRPDDPTFLHGDDLRDGLDQMSRSFFRVRPWFEPGPWGGQWIKDVVPQLPRDAPNYAWSFELITPENGLVFESGGLLAEVSFDCLMYRHGQEVLGDFAARFGAEFPIRFDWLDTMDGGNLSLQCHPRPEYIRERFGEKFTQDETYYILDCESDAQVYLGFQAGVDPAEFREELERSRRESVEADVDQFVARWPAKKHDLFLIPNGTVHCSGRGNMVLEISATPYIFTFKMYDWMRLDLDGKPRPLNIERAFENLYFERQGTQVRDELISRPVVIESGADWRLIHLPTHPEHFYDIHRFEFQSEAHALTDGSPHVLALVEGASILLVIEDGFEQRFTYAETFVVPAAARSYRLINQGGGTARVVKAFLKKGTG